MVRSLPRVAVGALALVAAAGSAWASSPASDGDPAAIKARERTPLALLTINAADTVGFTSVSESMRIISDVLEARTNFSVDVQDSRIAMSVCEGRMSCIVRLVRKDYERDRLVLPNGQVAPYSEHLEAVAGQLYPRYLVVLSSLSEPGRPARLSAVLVDTDEALALWHEASRVRTGWEREVEARVNDEAVKSRPRAAAVSDAAQTTAYLEKLFTVSFRSAFERSGNWEPYGTIEIVNDVAGLEIRLDGELLGTTRSGRTRIVGVTTRRRSITLEHPNFSTYTAQVDVRRGDTVSLVAEVHPTTVNIGRAGVLWGGAGLAAAGAALIAVAVADARSSDEVWCVYTGSDDSQCGNGSEFKTLASAPGDNGDPNPPGVLTAPLGYSLIGLGGMMSLGVLLTDDEDDVPWWAVWIGVAMGALSYGLSHAFNGETGFKVEPKGK